MNTSNSNQQESKVQSSLEKPVETLIPNTDKSIQASMLHQSSLQNNRDKTMEELLNEQEKLFKDKEAQIKLRFKEMGVNLDKIKYKNNVYVEPDNKGKEIKLIEQRTIKFLQGKLQLQKGRSIKNERWVKIYKQELQDTVKLKISLQEIIRVNKQNSDALIKKLQDSLSTLEKQHLQLSQKYKSLSGEKQKQLQGQNSGSSIVPFIMTRIDDILKQRNKYVKLSQQDMAEFKSIKHDATGIVNKLVFLIEKLKEKQEEKDQLQKQQKVQTEFHNDEKKRLRELVADYSKKYRKSQQVVEIAKVENRRCLRIITEKQDKLDKLIKNRNQIKRKYQQYEKIQKIQGKKAAQKQALRRRKIHSRLQMKHQLLLPQQIEDKLDRICEEQYKIDQQNGVPMRKPTQKQLMFIEELFKMGAFNNIDENGKIPDLTQEQKNKMFEQEKARRKKEGIKLLKDPLTGKVSKIPYKAFRKKPKHKLEQQELIRQAKYFRQTQFYDHGYGVRGSTSTEK